MTFRAPLVLHAPAKINLSLEITGRRASGYHDVATVMQTVDLCDELSFEPSAELELECDGPSISTEDNLVIRAARALQRATDTYSGARIRLSKSIPLAAGLGGGSSDAAATLLGLCRLWNLAIAPPVLSTITASIGADVSFFLRGGLAIATGIGEIVEWLPDPTPRFVLLCTPEQGPVNKTVAAYRSLKESDFSDGAATHAIGRAFLDGTIGRDPWDFVTSGRNAFERAADDLYLSVPGARNAMLAAGAPWVRLSGAGPSLYSLFDSQEAAAVVARQLEDGLKTHVVQTRPSDRHRA